MDAQTGGCQGILLRQWSNDPGHSSEEQKWNLFPPCAPGQRSEPFSSTKPPEWVDIDYQEHQRQGYTAGFREQGQNVKSQRRDEPLAILDLVCSHSRPKVAKHR